MLKHEKVSAKADGPDPTLVRPSDWNAEHVIDDEVMVVLLRGGNLLHIPTNAGWTETLVGSGSTGEGVSGLSLITGATANSSALLTASLSGFRIGANYHLLDWDKKFYVVFNISRRYDIATAIARFQIKSASAEGALAAKGLGIRIDNLALKGESYGTSLGVVDLGVTLGDRAGDQVVIIHYPGDKIEWYVNGVLKGTQSAGVNIPSGQFGAIAVSSIINGVTASTVQWFIHHPKVWQEL